MLKSYKSLYLGLTLLVSTSALYAQNKPNFKDVLLNGKPAKLNTETGEFILVNGNKTDTIKSGMIYTNVASKTIAKDNIDTTKTVVAPTYSEEKITEETSPNFHVVQPGETLFGLSKKYGVSLEQLKKANGLDSNVIKVGEQLRVNHFKEANETPIKIEIWIVSKGDTLYSIARKNDLSVEALKQLNGLTSNTIHIGQQLQIKQK